MLAFPLNFRNFRVNGGGSQCPYDRLSPFVYGNAGDAIQFLALQEIIKTELHQDLWGFNSFYPELISLDRKTVQAVAPQDVRLIVAGYTGLFVNMFVHTYLPGPGHVRPNSCLYLGMSISKADQRDGTDGFDLALKLDLPQKLKPYGPIGCRDRATRDFLKAHGVDAYYSGCMTMGFYQRKPSPVATDTVILDLQPAFMRHLTEEVKATATKPTHCLLYRHDPAALMSNLDFFAQSRELLDYYRTKAKLIITSRIHGALPALALGIPVIFMSDCTDQRMDMMKFIIRHYHSDENIDFEQALREAEHPYFKEVSQAVRENAIDRILGKDDRSSIRRLEQILEYDYLGQR